MTERTPIAPVSALKRGSSIPQPPPRRPRATPPPTDDAPAEQQMPTRDAPAPRKSTRVQNRSAASASNDRSGTRPISLSVPADLLAEFRRYAKRTEVSYGDLLMDAVAAHRDELVDLVTAAQSSSTSDGLFVRETRSAPGALSTLSLRMLDVNVAAIDRLVENTGAQSRSQMCVAALAAHLSTRRDPRI